MIYKKKMLFFLILLCLGSFISYSYYTFETTEIRNNLNNGAFPKARIRIYQIAMPLVHEYDEDEYISLFREMSINRIIPVINDSTTIDKISTSKILEFQKKKNIEFNKEETSQAKILHHIVAISNGNPFNDGREKINFAKQKIECNLDNVYIGKKSHEFYSVDFRRNDIHGGKISLHDKEKYITTFTWDKNSNKYLLNEKNKKEHYNSDLILFDITSFIIDDANTISEMIDEMDKYGDDIIRLYSTKISVSLKLDKDRFKVTKTQSLDLLEE